VAVESKRGQPAATKDAEKENEGKGENEKESPMPLEGCKFKKNQTEEKYL